MATGIVPTHLFDRSPWLKPASTLLKPYTFDELLRTVMDVLAEAKTADSQRESTPSK